MHPFGYMEEDDEIVGKTFEDPAEAVSNKYFRARWITTNEKIVYDIANASTKARIRSVCCKTEKIFTEALRFEVIKIRDYYLF